MATGRAMQLLIRGVDYAAYVDIDSVDANNNVIMTKDNMSFVLYLNGELPAPRVGMEVIWRLWDYDTSSEVRREFGGVITSVGEATHGLSLVYEVGCDSYLRWFDRRLVSGYYQQQPAEVTIAQVIQRYCPGFTMNHVQPTGLYLVPQYFNYQRPSQAIKMVADQVQRGWYIDYNRDIHFFSFEDFPSPLPGNMLNIDTDTVNYGDLEFFEDGEQIFNRFYVRGYKQRSDHTYTLRFVGDGTTTQWSLGYRISSAKGDCVVKLNGQDWTVKRDILDGVPGQGGDPTVAYVHYTQHLIRFAEPPAQGTLIEVTFYYLVDKFRVDQDDMSIAYMAAIEDDPYSDGVYEYSQFDKSLTGSTMDSVTEKLGLLALKYGRPTVRGRLTSFTPGWHAGQSFRMNSAVRLGGITADETWFVHKVQKKWIQNNSRDVDPTNTDSTNSNPVLYVVEFANKPYMV